MQNSVRFVLLLHSSARWIHSPCWSPSQETEEKHSITTSYPEYRQGYHGLQFKRSINHPTLISLLRN